jgi:predicted anti-sigma-YlaC factor YlaD
MNCEQIRERMPDVAAGVSQATADESKHLAGCEACSEQLEGMRSTMALLDEWQAPEPSQYFDVRLQARLREEASKAPAGWFYWLRRPVLAAALTLLVGVGAGLLVTRGSGIYNKAPDVIADSGPGTAVSDLQTLDNNHDLYSDFELLDDLTVQQDVVANP